MFRLAVAQAPAELIGAEARIEWLRSILAGVVAQGADLVVLPELFVSGYNIGTDMPAAAQPMAGPANTRIFALAAEFGVAIHFGFAEAAGDFLYNSALCVSASGEVQTHQRKLAIPPGFERDYFTAGRGCALFELGGLKIATLICYDAEFPETVRHVAEQGAQLVLVPTALGAAWDWVAQSMIPTRAYENGVYLAYANSAGVENGMAFLGRSVIAAPDGKEAARAGRDSEVIYADIDPARVTAAQDRLPYLRDRAAIRF